jgi:hypothetical protein
MNRRKAALSGQALFPTPQLLDLFEIDLGGFEMHILLTYRIELRIWLADLNVSFELFRFIMLDMHVTNFRSVFHNFVMPAVALGRQG